MKCSSASTGSKAFRGRAGLLLALTAALVGGGCARTTHHTARPAPVLGYADLDVLVRGHPGWAGVARYDAALARLDQATGRQAPVLPGDNGLASLPPAPADTGPIGIVSLAGPRRRLEQVERVQVARLVGRQAQSRQRQLGLERVGWERQAQAQYDRARAAALGAYGQRLDRLSSDEDARRLNLALQIRALQKIVTGWDLSKPPTPRLNQAKADLARKQDELAGLETAQGQAVAQARSERDAALAQARSDRASSVTLLLAQERTRLQAQDRRGVAALQARLSAQRAALLRLAQSPPAAPVPPAGELGSESLPPSPAMVTLSPDAVRSLRAARGRLVAQRARWLAFLYDDTRAAALDAAGQQHWLVSFGRNPVPGRTDLTAPLARALAGQAWKT